MSDEGQIVRTPVDDISTVGRNTMGVTVVDLGAGDHVASVDVVPAGRMAEDAVSEEQAETEAEVSAE
jgi:DNA gyrase subunit A